ncbi:MAG: hypothetical protein J0M15_03400 [Deltaproteobacteria bacterium]|jgi:hypothetical protein|nr:hypothetical protein [Deltaproteobacteria bacterium]
MKYYFGTILILFQSLSSAQISWEWVKSSKGKSTNSVIRELKKLNFLKAELPTFREDFGFEKRHKKSSLSDALLTVLGGPPDESISPNENSIVLTACRQHSCDEKGFYFADSKGKTSVMAIIHFIYEGKFDKAPQLFLASKNFKCGEYPDLVKSQIKFWLESKKLNPEKIYISECNN